MGQNQSARTPREEIKGPPARPTELPTSRLVSDLGPKSPSYYNPANCVLPSVLTGIKDVQLRPVSQELSQYHPDFKDIFSSPNPNENDQNTENVPTNGDISNEDVPHEEIPNENFNNTILSSSYPGLQSSVLANGLPSSSARVNGGPVENGMLTQSVSGKVRGHRRQMSATSSLYIRETIPEDPNEEPLEMRGKIDPISMDTSYTSQVSIPVKNSFDLDKSYNMTYAQLAEARRSKTLMDIEKRTGKKLEDLSFDLADNTEEGSFSRNPSVRSVKSAVSLDSGMKKKKRAPPPPSQPPPPQPSSTTQKPSAPPPPRPAQPPQRKSHSFEEPPVDYDMDTLDNAHVKRSMSLRTPAAPPPPSPMTKSILKKSGTSGPYTTNNQYPSSAIETTAQSAPTTPRSTSMYKSPPVLPPPAKANQSNPFLAEIQKRAERISIRRQESEQAEMDKKASNVEPPTVEEPSEEVENLNFTDISIAEDEPNLVFQSASLTPRETQDKYSPRPPPLMRQTSVDSGVVESSATTSETQKPGEGLQRQPSETSTTSGVSSNDSNTVQATRRLSSLLQHDIKIAAQAKATKMVKHTTPVKEKPKDPAQIFREQLQKAAAEREARCKEGKTIDSQLAKQREKEREQEENLVFKSDIVTVKRTDSMKEFHKSEEVQKKDTGNVKEELSEFPRPQFLKKSSTAPSGLTVRSSRQRAPDSDDEDASKNYRDSVYGGEDWVPEDDLSDDNLSDDQMMTSPRHGMEGFKTSIIPQKVKDLKAKSKPPKVKEKKYKKNSDSSADERRKFDSIKKFKKSVHKSVRNAFGSISKASGKIMKKQRSEDFEIVQDAPRNWKLTASHSEPAVNRMMMANDLGAQEDSSEDEESVLESSVSESHSSHKASESNGRGDDEESEDDDDRDDSKEHDVSTMKRAGVAYVNNKGQIVLLPEYDTVNGRDRERFEGSAPKVVPKKKKFAYDATVRRKEREMKEEMISKEIQEKEKQREEEKQKERETEIEFRRLRELEARDRLQQLELQAAMQQQLLQQQQQQLGFLSAPPLPPPTGFQQGYNPAAFEYSSMMNQPNLPHGGMGQHYGSQPTFRGPLFNAGVPGLSYDFNDYMRMMQGLQPNQNNVTSAYGFMLNGSTWPNPVVDVKGFVDYSKVSNNSVPTDDSQRNEVYTTWQGPTKQVVPNPNSESGSAQRYVVNGDSPANQQYHSNGANDPSGKGEDSNSDVSVSEGLSPQRASMVAKIHVGDFRPSVTENNVGLFKSSISVPNLSTPRDNSDYR